MIRQLFSICMFNLFHHLKNIYCGEGRNLHLTTGNFQLSTIQWLQQQDI